DSRPAPVAVTAEPGRIALVADRVPGSLPDGGWRRVVRWPEHADTDWCAGFLAGVVDACGVVADGELRVVHTDEAVVGRVAGALHRLGFAFAVGAQENGARVVRLVGGVGALRALLARTGPA